MSHSRKKNVNSSTHHVLRNLCKLGLARRKINKKAVYLFSEMNRIEQVDRRDAIKDLYCPKADAYLKLSWTSWFANNVMGLMVGSCSSLYPHDFLNRSLELSPEFEWFRMALFIVVGAGLGVIVNKKIMDILDVSFTDTVDKARMLNEEFKAIGEKQAELKATLPRFR